MKENFSKVIWLFVSRFKNCKKKKKRFQKHFFGLWRKTTRGKLHAPQDKVKSRLFPKHDYSHQAFMNAKCFCAHNTPAFLL